MWPIMQILGKSCLLFRGISLSNYIIVQYDFKKSDYNMFVGLSALFRHHSSETPFRLSTI